MRRGWFGAVIALGAVVAVQAGVAAPIKPSPAPSAAGLIVPIQGGDPRGVDAVGGTPAPSPSPGGGGGGGGLTPNDPQSPGAGPVQGEDTSPVGRRTTSPTPRPSAS